jgi:hypothetical protein
MAVVATMDIKGDTRELIDKYEIVNHHLMTNATGGPPEGMIAHFCLETPDGIRVSNVWDTDEHAKGDVENPVLREALAKAQMPEVTPQFFPVHNHFIVSEMKAAV